jgi:hypothetical protein
MKNIFLAIYTFAFLFAAVHFIPTGKKVESDFYEGYPESAEGSKKEMSDYFFRMLRDPATNEIPRHIRQKELEFAATLPTDMDDEVSTKSNFPNTFWNIRGPLHVGGMTRVLAMDVTNSNVLIAGTNSGGIWRSTNAGVAWSETFPKAKYDGATCIVQDKRPGHTNTWYIGSGDPYASAGAGGRAYYLGNGIKKSTDNGVTWTQCNTAGNQFSFDNYFDFVYNIDMRNYNGDSTLYAACYSAILKSTNGGTSWSIAKGNSLSVAANAFYTDVCVTPNGVVYATLSSDGGGSKGIWRSTDGITFTNITPSIISASYDLIKIGFAPSDENQVYFMVSQSTNYGISDTNYVGEISWKMLLKYNFISGDGSGVGGKWTDLSQNLPTSGGPFDKLNLQTSYNMLVKVHPTDTNIVFIGGTNLYRSTTGFKDNTHTTFCGGYLEGAHLPVVESYENHHPDQHELLFHPNNPNQVFSANDGGVFRCDNILATPVVWTPLNQGYLTTMFYTVALEHTLSGDNTVIGGTQDNGTWFTNSPAENATWVHPNGGDGSYCAIADGKSKYFFSLQKGKIRMCNVDDNGTVTSFSRIEPIGAKNYEFINPFVIDPNTNNQMYLPEGTKMWRNNNLGGIPMNNNWDSISTNWEVMTDSLPFAGSITAVAISKSPANILYYGTDAKKVYKVVNANVSPTTAIDITPSLANSAGFVSCIAVHPNDANKVMVTYANYAVYSIFYSEDGGTTWKKVAGNLEQFSSGSGNGPSVRWAQIVPYNADTTAFFVATSTGLYATVKLRTDVDSTVWVQQGTQQIGNSVCTMIDYRAVDGQMVVATHARGIFSAKIDKNYFLGIKRKEQISQGLNMKVYPNPINTSATIEYDLPASCKVSISITDAMGRVCKTYQEGVQSKGMHQFYFHRNDLSSGLYYAIINCGGATKCKAIQIKD